MWLWRLRNPIVCHVQAGESGKSVVESESKENQGQVALSPVSPGLRVMSDSFVTPWAIAHLAPLSMRFPKQEYWTKLPFFLRGSSWPRDQTHISCIGRRILYHSDTWQVLVWIQKFENQKCRCPKAEEGCLHSSKEITFVLPVSFCLFRPLVQGGIAWWLATLLRVPLFTLPINPNVNFFWRHTPRNHIIQYFTSFLGILKPSQVEVYN